MVWAEKQAGLSPEILYMRYVVRVCVTIPSDPSRGYPKKVIQSQLDVFSDFHVCHCGHLSHAVKAWVQSK